MPLLLVASNKLASQREASNRQASQIVAANRLASQIVASNKLATQREVSNKLVFNLKNCLKKANKEVYNKQVNHKSSLL